MGKEIIYTVLAKQGSNTKNNIIIICVVAKIILVLIVVKSVSRVFFNYS